ncbi:MAG TPA: hypothetical protein VM510_05995, partial [Caulifigura sp.]|nr:hypothetical protein [Caulifigura sp.]
DAPETEIDSVTAGVDEVAEEIVAPVTPTIPKPRFVQPAVPALKPVASQPAETGGGADLLPRSHLHEHSPAWEPRPEESPVRPSQPVSKPEPPAREPRRRESSRKFRIDNAHEEHANQHVEIRPERSRPQPAIERAEHAPARPGRDFRDDSPHASLRAPHFDLETYAEVAGRKPGRQESIFGQLLAYLGVGLLTIGTALVVWGYFGGPAVQRYQSTGWLVSTAGQMLLFLGVVTLVSGGMQQTTHEVAQRVEYLGGKMHRIEQSQQELLKGPYFAKERSGSKVSSRDDDDSAYA